MIKHKGNQEYEGLSTDTKPVPADTAVNATFAETDTGLLYRNNGTTWLEYSAAGGNPSAVETLTNKTIDFDSNTVLYSGPYNYYLYKTGTTYKLRDNTMGAIISSNTTLETVWQAGLDLCNKKSMYVFPGDYTISSTGLDINQFETYLHMDREALIVVPNGFAGSLFEIMDGKTHCQIIGGSMTEAGTQQRLWNCYELHSTSAGAGITGTYIAHSWVKNAWRVIRLHTDNDANAWINSNTFYDIHIDHSKIGIDFDHGAIAKAMNDNSFNSIFFQSRTGTTTHGVRNVTGRGNTFIDSKFWDPLTGMISMNILPAALGTTIIKGKVVYPVFFEDLSDTSIILDQEVGGMRIGKKINKMTLTGAHDGTWGAMSGIATVGEGVLAGVTTSGTPSQITDYTAGHCVRYTSGGVSGDNAGFRHTSVIAYRGWQPYLKCTFRVNDVTNCRLYIGWKANSTEPTGDTDLTTVEGFMVGFIPGDTQFMRMRNDGSGAANRTAITGTTKDTGIHTFEIVMGEVLGLTDAVGLNFDSVATMVSTTDLPATTTPLYPHFQIETATGAAKTIDRFAFDVRTGR